MSLKAPMRKVARKGIHTVTRKGYSYRNGPFYYPARFVNFLLECGHYEKRSFSDRRLTKMRCYECLWIMEDALNDIKEEGENS